MKLTKRQRRAARTFLPTLLALGMMTTMMFLGN
jgi:hypothetical protein